MTVGLSLLFEFEIPVVFTFHFFGLPTSCILLYITACHPPNCRFSHFMFAYLLCCSWLLRHLEFLWLACLTKLDHFLPLQRIHMCSISTLHMPNCVILEFLYVFRNAFVFVATIYSIITLEIKFLICGLTIYFHHCLVHLCKVLLDYFDLMRV